jgi:hypothetical protein
MALNFDKDVHDLGIHKADALASLGLSTESTELFPLSINVRLGAIVCSLCGKFASVATKSVAQPERAWQHVRRQHPIDFKRLQNVGGGLQGRSHFFDAASKLLNLSIGTNVDPIHLQKKDYPALIPYLDQLLLSVSADVPPIEGLNLYKTRYWCPQANCEFLSTNRKTFLKHLQVTGHDGHPTGSRPAFRYCQVINHHSRVRVSYSDGSDDDEDHENDEADTSAEEQESDDSVEAPTEAFDAFSRMKRMDDCLGSPTETGQHVNRNKTDMSAIEMLVSFDRYMARDEAALLSNFYEGSCIMAAKKKLVEVATTIMFEYSTTIEYLNIDVRQLLMKDHARENGTIPVFSPLQETSTMGKYSSEVTYLVILILLGYCQQKRQVLATELCRSLAGSVAVTTKSNDIPLRGTSPSRN